MQRGRAGWGMVGQGQRHRQRVSESAVQRAQRNHGAQPWGGMQADRQADPTSMAGKLVQQAQAGAPVVLSSSYLTLDPRGISITATTNSAGQERQAVDIRSGACIWKLDPRAANLSEQRLEWGQKVLTEADWAWQATRPRPAAPCCYSFARAAAGQTAPRPSSVQDHLPTASCGAQQHLVKQQPANPNGIPTTQDTAHQPTGMHQLRRLLADLQVVPAF